MEDGALAGVEGLFVHPVLDDAVMAGNGTIGLELVEDLDEIDTVLIPWGGGGLSTGIASALAALSPSTRVFACEPETGAPFAASSRPGRRSRWTTRHRSSTAREARRCSARCGIEPSRCSSDGRRAHARRDGSAVRMLAERARVIAEGAGALAVAAALSGRAGQGRIVCIVSGGNIDAARLARDPRGHTPD